MSLRNPRPATAPRRGDPMASLDFRQGCTRRRAGQPPDRGFETQSHLRQPPGTRKPFAGWKRNSGGRSGSGADELIGESIHRLNGDPKKIERFLKNPNTLPHQDHVHFRSGHPGARESTGSPASGKEILGYVVAWEDVTSRLLLEAELRRSGQIAAINKSQAVIEFEMDGTIITANDNFLRVMGYTLDEVKGRHHSMFVDDATRQSAELPRVLGTAQPRARTLQQAEYKRLGKGGREVWIQASYNPILGQDRPSRSRWSTMYSTDVTAAKLRNADFASQVSAIGKIQAVIEFQVDGTIVNANDKFLGLMGYRLDEVTGRHHSLFVDPATAGGVEYRQFWAQTLAQPKPVPRHRPSSERHRQGRQARCGFRARTSRDPRSERQTGQGRQVRLGCHRPGFKQVESSPWNRPS